MLNQKHSAKYVCRTGTSASSTARAGTSCEKEQRRTRNLSSTPWISSRFPNTIPRKGRPHGHRYGKKPGDHEYFIANSLKKKCKKKNFLGIHDRFIRDEKFRKNMFDVERNEEICREMDKLANEDHTRRIIHWRWNSSLSKQLVDPFEHSWFRHDARKASPWFQRSIVYLATPQEPRGSGLLPKLVAKLFLILVELARYLVASLIWDITGDAWPSTDWSGKPVEKWLGQLFEVWYSELIWCRITVQNSPSPTEGVNTIPPIQQNSLKNGYDENKGHGESYENKCATNYSIITNNYWNNTHKKQLTNA